MFSKISYTWSIMGASWRILKEDTHMVLFPLLSGISCILVVASFLVPMFFTGFFGKVAHDRNAANNIAYYLVLFAFYFTNYFIITFFNTGLTACALKRLTGQPTSFSDGVSEAARRIHLILGWALLAATVGMILKVIEERSGKVGQIVSGILGTAWSLITYLAIPVLVAQNKGPIETVKESTTLLKNTWGSQLVGNFSFSVIFFLLALPSVGGILGGVYLAVNHMLPVAILLWSSAIIWILALSLVQSALQTIFQAAVYLYATDAQVLAARGFPVALVAEAITVK